MPLRSRALRLPLSVPVYFEQISFRYTARPPNRRNYICSMYIEYYSHYSAGWQTELKYHTNTTHTQQRTHH